MAESKRKLFRTEAIERMSSPDDLEALMPLAHPKEWLTIAVTATLMFLFLLWSFVGHIPTFVSGRGLLLRPNQVLQVQIPVSGRLQDLRVHPGDAIREGDILAAVDLEDIRKRLEESRRSLTRLLDQNVQEQGVGRSIPVRQDRQNRSANAQAYKRSS